MRKAKNLSLLNKKRLLSTSVSSYLSALMLAGIGTVLLTKSVAEVSQGLSLHLSG